MVRLSLLSVVLVSVVDIYAAAVLESRAVKPSINNSVEHGVNTECKTCPYNLCPNKAAYESEDIVTVTCYTHGDVIDRGGNDGNNVWLKTDKGCYVTQYDLLLYNGTYEKDLAYCGKSSEVKKYTQAPAKVKYNSECWVCPSITCDNVAYYKYGKDVTATCYTDQDDPGEESNLGDETWVKTTQNCYVSEVGLDAKPDRSKLDNCGPIPFLQVNQTTKGTPSSTEPTEKRAAAQALDKRYLLAYTVGEDFASCYKSSTTTSHLQKRYTWNTKVTAQCYEENESSAVEDAGYWLLTTDFCWVRERDLWESVTGHYRFPRCSLFV